MADKLSVTVDAQDLQAQLSKIQKNLTDFRPAWPMVERYTARQYRLQFSSEGAHFGTPWKPLKVWPRPQRKGRRGGNRGGILRDFNRLWASYTKYRSGSGDGVSVWDRFRFEKGSQVPYARFHQTGTKHMPARPVHIDPLPEKVQETYLALIARYVVPGADPVTDGGTSPGAGEL